LKSNKVTARIKVAYLLKVEYFKMKLKI